MRSQKRVSENQPLVKKRTQLHGVCQSGVSVPRVKTRAFQTVTVTHIVQQAPFFPLKQKWWRSGEGARLPPMWPGIESWRPRHMWVEFVVGCLPCSERFFFGYSGFPLSLKTNTFISNSIWNARTRLIESHELLSARRVNKLQKKSGKKSKESSKKLWKIWKS